MGEILLRVQNLSKYYQMGEVTVKALEDVSFEVEKGEFIVILGPSGSGKSTLLNIIGGMDTPTGGSVIFNGEMVTNFTDKELTMYRRHKIGFVFQFYNLIRYYPPKDAHSPHDDYGKFFTVIDYGTHMKQGINENQNCAEGADPLPFGPLHQNIYLQYSYDYSISY
jgi:ABC-type Fe3+/spermidine/putrescine transport system ATPase subunit